MTKKTVFLLVLLNLAFTALVSYAVGIYAASQVPEMPQFAVIDVDELTMRIDPNDPQRVEKAEQLAARARVVTESLVQNGIVVLDRARVLGAPENAVVRID